MISIESCVSSEIVIVVKDMTVMNLYLCKVQKKYS